MASDSSDVPDKKNSARWLETATRHNLSEPLGMKAAGMYSTVVLCLCWSVGFLNIDVWKVAVIVFKDCEEVKYLYSLRCDVQTAFLFKLVSFRKTRKG